MDLQGIGAIAAAAVAAFSVSAALLVGRWQTGAALRAADATLRTADATYRAAIDAVQTQVAASHHQWRHQIQRDGYAAFLLAAKEVATASERLIPTDSISLSGHQRAREDATIACSKLASAYEIVELEGPLDVAQAAATLNDCTLKVMHARYMDNQRMEALVGILEAERDDSLMPEVRASLRELYDRIDVITTIYRNERQQWAGGEIPAEVLHELHDIERLCASIRRPFVTRDIIDRLKEIPIHGRPTERGRHESLVAALTEARNAFILGTRAYLNTQSNHTDNTQSGIASTSGRPAADWSHLR
jgi:hypothetical protein